ncbi:MAG: hypothetical protein JF888_01355 [Candidatus Dormibacteraeota bacterium]|uniref:PLAT domain-containing protein n=1 Tax=Candidatus Dormiibacter inghamiae TaxID=3127013 RepID=A0A934NG95_9BACT|nr:hypothetical protein [Candidatus Dormibacteraeota bacterium]MBJ7605577.1 hypothetical protein [Candidatus Dormibacteraeota bacterium]
MRCLLSSYGIDRPTTVRKLALGVGMKGSDGLGAICLSNLVPRLGPAPHPFYVVGHNPNTIDDVHSALDAGANAIEPDVNVYEDSPRELCISETGKLDTDKGGDASAPSLGDFLDALHIIAQSRPELALVVFDCKPKVATAEHGVTLLNEVRRRLTFDTDVNVIISVSDRTEKAIFDRISGMSPCPPGMLLLGPREGLMCDGDNDPGAVSELFTEKSVGNQCYGNGVAWYFHDPDFSPHLRPSIERACGLKAANGRIKFIYTWSLGDATAMREAMRIGVDGVIPGIQPAAFDKGAVSELRMVMAEPEFRPLYRLADRGDNPFAPANTAYALMVQTGNISGAGTDANVRFTLSGTFGSSSKSVDTSLRGSVFGGTPGRMERGSLDYVTLPSQDLGSLTAITVQRDDQGWGPDWYLDNVMVLSLYCDPRVARFGRWIDSTSPFTQTLVPLP